MADKRFRVVARVSSSNTKAIKPVLEQAITSGSIKEMKDELVVEAEMNGETAKELNRSLLSALRRVEKKTRSRAEWTSDDGTTQRFFDYVLKKTTKSGRPT
jgi:polyhydroxyalkanoate synthesis regulator phasin